MPPPLTIKRTTASPLFHALMTGRGSPGPGTSASGVTLPVDGSGLAPLPVAAAVPAEMDPSGGAVTGLVPAIDQTRNVGLVTLPGTFVGLVLGGASPAEAARVQLTVLLALLAVEVVAAVVVARLVVAGVTLPGERVGLTGGSSRG